MNASRSLAALLILLLASAATAGAPSAAETAPPADGEPARQRAPGGDRHEEEVEPGGEGTAEDEGAGAGDEGAPRAGDSEEEPDADQEGPADLVPPAVRAEQQRRKANEDEIETLEKRRAERPDDADLLERLVSLLLQEHRGSEALEEAEAFVVAHPTLAPGYIVLGRALFWSGQYDGAQLQFQRAATMDPKSAQAHLWHSRLLAATGDRAGAAKALRAALEVAPADTEALATLAHGHEDDRKFEEAARIWDRVAGLRAQAGQEAAGSAARAAMCRDLASGKAPSYEMPPGGVTVPLFTFNNVPAVKVRLNGKVERYMFLDLSAQDSVLTRQAAFALGTKEFGGPSSFEEGEVPGAPANAILEAVQIGPLTVTRVPAAVNPFLAYPMEETAGLLGRRFLSEFLVTLDYVGRTVTFAPRAAKPIEGTPLYLNSALLVDGRARGRSAGKFLLDTSSYTPGPMSLIWVQDNLGLTPMSIGTTPILFRNYSFTFTMPHLEIGGVTWRSFNATAVDFRSLSQRLGTEITGVLAASMLTDLRVTFDLAHMRMRLERLREQEFRSPGKLPPAPPSGPSGQASGEGLSSP